MVGRAKMGLKSIVYAGIVGLALAGGVREARATIVPFNSNSEVKLGVAYYIQTDKSIYDLGENVEMLFRVTNLKNENVTLGGVLADPLNFYLFRVMQDGSQAWRYYHPTSVTDFCTFDLDPYESREFQSTWNMMNDNGTSGQEYDDFLVSPGLYNVWANLALTHSYELDTPVSVPITIVPEPGSLVLLGVGMLFLIRKGKVKHS